MSIGHAALSKSFSDGIKDGLHLFDELMIDSCRKLTQTAQSL